MPVAIRKRSWEDHVTPRTGLQYSYDDLDLVCCHVRYQRGRCASMPECSHHQPRTLLCPQEDIRDGRRTMERITVLTCGKVECSYTDEAVIPNLSSSTSQEIHIPEASSDANKANLVSKRCIVLQGQDIENQEDDGIFKCSDLEMLKIGSLKPPACETSQLEPSGKTDILETRLDCFSKLQTIHEGSFPESGDEASAQISAEMPEHLASAELKTNNCENLTTSEYQNMSLKEPTGEETQPEGLYDEHQEREKERSSLDSMVQLIMKLDQLDKEIENALSSSLNSTPNLKRQIISVSACVCRLH
uniref:Uncharacterized protein n=1 Tax=Sinocyclocheilus grahami TaxID=75366 RepID=A0A672QQS7_SINGR